MSMYAYMHKPPHTKLNVIHVQQHVCAQAHEHTFSQHTYLYINRGNRVTVKVRGSGRIDTYDATVESVVLGVYLY